MLLFYGLWIYGLVFLVRETISVRKERLKQEKRLEKLKALYGEPSEHNK